MIAWLKYMTIEQSFLQTILYLFLITTHLLGRVAGPGCQLVIIARSLCRTKALIHPPAWVLTNALKAQCRMLVTSVWQAVRLPLWNSVHQVWLSVSVLCLFSSKFLMIFFRTLWVLLCICYKLPCFRWLFFSIKLQNDVEMIFQWVSWLNANQSPSSFVHSQSAQILFLFWLAILDDFCHSMM